MLPRFLARFSLRFSLSDFCAVFFWSFFGFAEPFIRPSYGADATAPVRARKGRASLRGDIREAREPRAQQLAVWTVARAGREVERNLVETLEQVEHRAVLVLAQPA